MIDFLTVLNLVGRSKARDTKRSSCKEFLSLLDTECILRKLDFVGFKNDEESTRDNFVTSMQFGLLREAPTIWLPKWDGGPVSKVKPKPNRTWRSSRKSSRKRKTVS
jgi:hypothetical protein